MAESAPMFMRAPQPLHLTNELSAQYDYCMVFKMEKDSNGQLTVVPETAKYVVEQMNNAGLETFSYLSTGKDEILVLIRCPFEKMSKFADEINFKMELHPEKLKAFFAQGVVENGMYVIAPRIINDSTLYSPYNPFNMIYGKYDTDLDQSLYLDIDENPKHFTRLVRLKVLYYMLKAPHRLGGCDLEISKLLFKKRITAFYPLHDRFVADNLAEISLSCCSSPWTFPFHDFRNYFGEKIALYFVFLGHYSKWLIVPALVGTVFQLIVWGTENYSSPVLPFFAVIIALWAILMMEYWKREEKSTAMIWGMRNFEADEPDRPEFEGDLIRSYINGGEMTYFSGREFGERVAGSMSIIGGFMLLLLGVVASIYILRFALQSSIGANASTVASILNTIQITVLNMVYQRVVVYLTDVENHRTDTQYEDSLTVKLFAFQFVNSYASFFFLAFIAQYLESAPDTPEDHVGQCGYKNCMQPLSVNLGIIFGSRIAMGIFSNVVTPCLQKCMQRSSDFFSGVKLSPPEKDFGLLPYNTMIEGINNYADSAIQFGFSVLFVTALPFAPLLSLAANYFRVKGIAWKLTKFYQRPVPVGAEDIGTWQDIFQFISIAAVITNAAMVCFTMDVLKDFTTAGKLWIFLAFQWCLIGVQFLLQTAVPDEPEEIAIQAKRSKFIVSKAIDRTPDEDPISVEEYEAQQQQRQALAMVASESADQGCLKALFGGKSERRLAKKKEKALARSADIKMSEYPYDGVALDPSITHAQAHAHTHNPMAGV